jgi:hypothetical protein
MKTIPSDTFYDLPLSELRTRAECAREMLRELQSRVASQNNVPARNPARSLTAIDEALAAVDGLLPGLLERPGGLLIRTVRGLAPRERSALRQAIESERTARERLTRVLGAVPPAQAADALVRVETQELLATELSALFRVIERACCASPTLTA